MPKYYNAIEAARILNISDKTVRRYVAKGKIAAKRTEFNEIAIPESEIERMRLELDQARSQLVSPEQGIDSLGSSDTISIESLEARITELESVVADQTKRIADLESRLIESQQVPRQSTPPIPSQDTTITTSTRISRSEPNIPGDWVLCSDFFSSLNIKETTSRRWLKDGLAGKCFEFEERPRPGRDDQTIRYFTPDQQQKALDILKRHGKLPDL